MSHAFAVELIETEVSAFEDRYSEITIQASSGNHNTSPLPGTPCPVLVRFSQAGNIAKLDSDETIQILVHTKNTWT